MLIIRSIIALNERTFHSWNIQIVERHTKVADLLGAIIHTNSPTFHFFQYNCLHSTNIYFIVYSKKDKMRMQFAGGYWWKRTIDNDSWNLMIWFNLFNFFLLMTMSITVNLFIIPLVPNTGNLLQDLPIKSQNPYLFLKKKNQWLTDGNGL